MIELLSARAVNSPADVEFLGSGLADRLKIPQSSDAFPVIAARGSRTEGVSGWAIAVVAPEGLADECWVEASDAAFGTIDAVVSAALYFQSPDVIINDVTFQGGPREFDSNRADGATIAVSAVAVLFVASMIRLRRTDLALYRSLGFPPTAASIPIVVEVLGSVLLTSSLATITWYVVAFDEPISHPVLAAAGSLLAATFTISLVTTALFMLIANRNRSIVEVVREGG
ncbi:MAG: hypothetical protein GY720_17895 [bacterium]|nr:hypothetical protein [Actinomycetes bacterium]MCP3976361.1 hypothetical protein [bacterium]MCP4085165.1 hypothetical protein [Actinomycetes bacterium]